MTDQTDTIFIAGAVLLIGLLMVLLLTSFVRRRSEEKHRQISNTRRRGDTHIALADPQGGVGRSETSSTGRRRRRSSSSSSPAARIDLFGEHADSATSSATDDPKI